MSITPVKPFDVSSMQSYKNYLDTKTLVNNGINDRFQNDTDRKDRVPLSLAITVAKQAFGHTSEKADAAIQELCGQIKSLEAPNVYSIAKKDGGKRTITTSKEGMEILDTDARGKTVEDTDLLADGTKVVTTYNEYGEPAKRLVTEPDGTAKTPEYCNTTTGKWMEGDPIPVGPGKTTVQEYGNIGEKKLYDETLETLTDGSTRVTIESKSDSEKYVINGKLGVREGAGGLFEFVEVSSSQYSSLEKGLKIKVKDNVTTINDDKKGVNITMMKDKSYQAYSSDIGMFKIQYEYKEGPIKSSTISGIYEKDHPQGENNSCTSWIVRNGAEEKVQFRDGREATIKYGEYGNKVVSVQGVNMDENAWKEVGYNPYNKDESILHVNPTFSNTPGSYLHPFRYMQGLGCKY